MTEKKFLQSVFDIDANEASGEFEGYASVFEQTDSVRDRVRRGAFLKSLSSNKEHGQLPPMLWQHDTHEPIGVWHEIYEDQYGLYAKGQLFVRDIPRARQAYRLIQEGGLSGLSIGFKAVESERDPDNGVRILTEIKLLEISLVTFPALESARISQIKKSLCAGGIPDTRTLEGFLRDAGFSRKQAKGFIAAGYRSLAPREAVQNDDALTRSSIRALTAQLQDWTQHNLSMKG